ncbi:hypothetical protein BG36_02040 [Aquamicrobium defluvii]|uniref:Uncharacterized protein n=2 Tax=Aquamicrobium defluvii TaxID=69279 RepID=A0A011UXP3_9HYPH|nr:hypothetical protein BG36_02040 [Aquamicrobium defluvii]EZQ17843.1 hypothetical protein CF98_33665 [Halopseudomonas bauzanensis]
MKAGHFSAKIPGQLSAEINISWIAANALLLYFFVVIAFYLHELSSLDQRRQMRIRQGEDVPGHAPELFLFVGFDIVVAALGETEDEERPSAAPVDATTSTRFWHFRAALA